MKIESKLNEDIFIESQKINLDFIFNKKIKSVKQNFIFLIIIFFISYQLMSEEIRLGYILLGYALMLLINLTWFCYSYLKIKKQHFKNIEKEISYYRENPEEKIIFEFREKDFYYKDYKMEFTLIWGKFKGFQCVNDFLILKSFGSNYLNFFLSKEGMDVKEFDKTIVFVRDKMKSKN